MVRRAAQSQPDVPLFLTMPREEAAKRIQDRIGVGSELKTRQISTKQGFDEVAKALWTWSEYNEELLGRMFTSPRIAEEYRASMRFFIARDYSLAEGINDLHRSIDTKIRRLSSVKERLELIPLAPSVAEEQPVSLRAPSVAGDKVFLVHGHDEAVLQAVARFVGKLGLTPVILHEQASKGRTVIEKLEQHGEVGFAVVLLTPDDVGGSSEKTLRPRARQNVVLELGYFLGRLERQHVCALYSGELELPSDYMGVVYVPFDEGGGWQLKLAKELKAAGFSLDTNKLV